MAIDFDRCVIPSDTETDPRLIAARCAELFAVRNGYTDLPPVGDSSQWVREFIEVGIDNRRNELRRQPFRVCPAGQRTDDGFGVLFWYDRAALVPEATPDTGELGALDPGSKDDSRVRYARMLEMRSDFSELRFVHQDLGPIGEAPSECLSLNPGPAIRP